MLTRKERMCRALRHEPVDHLPTQINYTGAMGKILAAHYAVSVENLPERLGNHLLRVDLTFPRRLSDDGKAYFDWWGVGWSTETEGYWPVNAFTAALPSRFTPPSISDCALAVQKNSQLMRGIGASDNSLT